MSRGKPINVNEITRACDLIADGKTLSQVATILDRSVTGINRALLETWPEEYEAAKEKRRDRIRSERWERAFDRKDKWSAKFLDDLAYEQLPETREARLTKLAVEHTGSTQLEVTVEHDYGRLIDKLAAVGLIGRPQAALDAADQPLLPARPD